MLQWSISFKRAQSSTIDIFRPATPSLPRYPVHAVHGVHSIHTSLSQCPDTLMTKVSVFHPPRLRPLCLPCVPSVPYVLRVYFVPFVVSREGRGCYFLPRGRVLYRPADSRTTVSVSGRTSTALPSRQIASGRPSRRCSSTTFATASCMAASALRVMTSFGFRWLRRFGILVFTNRAGNLAYQQRCQTDKQQTFTRLRRVYPPQEGFRPEPRSRNSQTRPETASLVTRSSSILSSGRFVWLTLRKAPSGAVRTLVPPCWQ